MHNDRALVSGAAGKKINLDPLPYKILEQVHTVNSTGKKDDEIITIIPNAGRTAEKWDESRKNQGLMKPISEVRKEVPGTSRFEKTNRFDKAKTLNERFQGRQDI